MRNVTNAWIRAVRDHGGSLEPRARLAAMVIASYADPDGSNCWPSVATVARGMGVSERTAQRALDDLEQAGWLVRWFRSGGSTVFRFLLPDDALAKAVDVALADDGGVTRVHIAVTGRCTGVRGECFCAPLETPVSPDLVTTSSVPRQTVSRRSRRQGRAAPRPVESFAQDDTLRRW